MADTVMIYGLIDPRTRELRYIGQSVDPLYRMRHHVKPVAVATETKRSQWLRDLGQAGLRPRQLIIDTVPIAERYEAEAKWIAHFRARGASLVNGSRVGTHHTDEARAKIKAARERQSNPRLGTHHTDESRAKMRAAWVSRKRAQQP